MMARSAPISAPPASGSSAKRRTVAFSLVASAVTALLKLLTGLASGSIGMLSEAAHSGLDTLASAVTLASVTVSDQPADEDHAYGHGKMENLAAFTEALLMIAAVIWILVEAVRRMAGAVPPLKLSLWPFLVLLLSIVVDFFRSRALARVARETRSQALKADALNYSNDMWSSIAVVAGLLATGASQYWHIPWLRFGDPVAAIAVAAVILSVCWRLVRETVYVLTDAAPIEVRRQVIDSLRQMPEILDIERIRLRLSGSHYFADVTVGMPRTLSFQRTEQMKERIAETVRGILPEADVLVNVVPRAARSESVYDRVRAVAARHDLAVHEMNVERKGEKLHLEQHLELPESLSLRDAHDLVTAVEGETKQDVPEIDSILTHIESERGTIDTETDHSRDARLERQLHRIAAEFPDILDIHDIAISNVRGRIQISCHCTLPDDRAMADVHDLITAFEDRVKAKIPQVARVLIHPEPATDNAR